MLDSQQVDYIRLQHRKGRDQPNEKATMIMEKIFATMYLIRIKSKIYKEFIQLCSKKANTLILEMGRESE